MATLAICPIGCLACNRITAQARACAQVMRLTALVHLGFEIMQRTFMYGELILDVIENLIMVVTGG